MLDSKGFKASAFALGLPLIGFVAFQNWWLTIPFLGFYLIFARILPAAFWLNQFFRRRKLSDLLCSLAVKPDPVDGWDSIYGSSLTRTIVISDTLTGFYWDLVLGSYLLFYLKADWGWAFLLFAGLELIALLYFLIAGFDDSVADSQLPMETKRLLIRRPMASDVQYFRKWLKDPELALHVGGVRSDEHIEQTFDFILKNWSSWGFGTAMVIWKESGEVVGSCGINKVELEGQTEFDLGYLIQKSHWNQGLATEAAHAVMEYAKHHLGLSRITAWPSSKNRPSVRVVEKLGFQFVKTISKNHVGTQLEDMSLYVWTSEP